METFLMMTFIRKNLALKSGHRSQRPKAENIQLWPNYTAYGHSLDLPNEDLVDGDSCEEDELIKPYYCANLIVTSSGNVRPDRIGCCETSTLLQYCTPANCSKLQWRKEPVIGDETYFTLVNLEVKLRKNCNKYLGNIF